MGRESLVDGVKGVNDRAVRIKKYQSPVIAVHSDLCLILIVKALKSSEIVAPQIGATASLGAINFRSRPGDGYPVLRAGETPGKINRFVTMLP